MINKEIICKIVFCLCYQVIVQSRQPVEMKASPEFIKAHYLRGKDIQ